MSDSKKSPLSNTLPLLAGFLASLLLPQWIVAANKAGDEGPVALMQRAIGEVSGPLVLAHLAALTTVFVVKKAGRARLPLFVALCSVSILLLLLVLHVVQPDLDPWQDAISLYVLTSHGYLMALIFVLSSALFLAAGYQLLGSSVSRILKPISMFMVGALVGSSVLTGLFQADPGQSMTSTSAELTPSGMLHKVGGGLAFPFRIAFPFLVLAQVWRTIPRRSAKVLLTFALSFPLLIATAIALPQYGGLVQRVFLVGYLTWLVLACRATNESRTVID